MPAQHRPGLLGQQQGSGKGEKVKDAKKLKISQIKPFKVTKPKAEDLVPFEDEIAEKLLLVPMRPPGLLVSKN